MASNTRTVRPQTADSSNALGWQPLRGSDSPPLVEQLVQHC